MHRQQRSATGFSLIELLIVVAIILTIAAIAIPNFLKSRMNANESSAIASLRVISTAQTTYFSTYNQGYADNLQVLAPPAPGVDPSPAKAGLIDDVLATGRKSGYGLGPAPCAGPACAGGTFTVQRDANNIVTAYALGAGPMACNRTGRQNYYLDEGLVIRFESSCSAAPTAASSPIPPG